MKFGKKAARPGSVQFKLADVLKTDKLPPRPKTFGHQALIKRWGVLGNDRVGDCVLAGAGHETMLTNRAAGRTVSVTAANALSDYSAITGYDPHDPNTDQGTDVTQAASYRRKTGVLDSKGQRHRVKAYLEAKKGNVEQILDAGYFLGAAGIGIAFPDFAMDQFNKGQPWDVVPNAPAPQDGHYIPLVGFDGTYLLIVTWGQVQKMTPAFYAKYCDEAVAYTYPDLIGSNGLTPEGFDQAHLDAMLSQVTAVA